MLKISGHISIYPGGRWLIALLVSLGLFATSTSTFGLDYLFWGGMLFFCFLVMMTGLFRVSFFNRFCVAAAVATAILLVIDLRSAVGGIGGGPQSHEWFYLGPLLLLGAISSLLRLFYLVLKDA